MKWPNFRRWRLEYQRKQRIMRRFLRVTRVTKHDLKEAILRCGLEGSLSWDEVDRQLRLFDFSTPRFTPLEISRW